MQEGLVISKQGANLEHHRSMILWQIRPTLEDITFYIISAVLHLNFSVGIRWDIEENYFAIKEGVGNILIDGGGN